MKKIFLLTLLAIFAVGVVSVRASEPTFRKKYVNLNYVSQGALEPETGLSVGKSNWGAAFSTGRTFVLHGREPIARMLYIGFDATWFDVNYAQLGDASGLLKINQADLGLFGVGPSVHIMPVGQLGIHAYFRYQPTLATFFGGDNGFTGGYASMFVSGGAISYGVISLGIEARWGSGKYSDVKSWFGSKEDRAAATTKLKTSGLRAYLGFRF